MKPIHLRAPLARAGVWSALLAATMLFGSACVVGSDEPVDDFDETAETDDELHGQSQESLGAFADEGTTQDDDGDDFDEADGWSDEREGQQILLPGVLVAEPEPDPWDDPMKNGHDDNGSGSKD